jgi:hypothetical protein
VPLVVLGRRAWDETVEQRPVSPPFEAATRTRVGRDDGASSKSRFDKLYGDLQAGKHLVNPSREGSSAIRSRQKTAARLTRVDRFG